MKEDSGPKREAAAFMPGVPCYFKRDFSFYLNCTFNKKVKGDAGPKRTHPFQSFLCE